MEKSQIFCWFKILMNKAFETLILNRKIDGVWNNKISCLLKADDNRRGYSSKLAYRDEIFFWVDKFLFLQNNFLFFLKRNNFLYFWKYLLILGLSRLH